MASQAAGPSPAGGETSGSSGPALRLLDEQPELGEHLDAGRAQLARDQLLVATCDLAAGHWTPVPHTDPERRGLGLLVLAGLLTRQVGRASRFAAELLGPGTLLRPWDRDDEAPLGFRVTWHVWEPARLAVLDRSFVLRARPWPEIIEAVCGLGVLRVAHLAVGAALSHEPRVEERLILLLWHLADRWGRVRPDGVLVPLRLTHELLGMLVGARRPSVTSGLGALERADRLRRLREGFLLLGQGPSLEAQADPVPRR
jgi:CRP/FNR family cyclic AMP-dependent transcriptional regulator